MVKEARVALYISLHRKRRSLSRYTRKKRSLCAFQRKWFGNERGKKRDTKIYYVNDALPAHHLCAVFFSFIWIRIAFRKSFPCLFPCWWSSADCSALIAKIQLCRNQIINSISAKEHLFVIQSVQLVDWIYFSLSLAELLNSYITLYIPRGELRLRQQLIVHWSSPASSVRLTEKLR